jgi:hypothetical protein
MSRNRQIDELLRRLRGKGLTYTLVDRKDPFRAYLAHGPAGDTRFVTRDYPDGNGYTMFIETPWIEIDRDVELLAGGLKGSGE